MNHPLAESVRLFTRVGKVGTLVAVATTLSLSSQAQEAPKEERVVVTGSRISRIDVEGPSPVYTISRQEIENSGVTQISDLMRNLPYNTGLQEADAVASFAGDSAQFNLRGVGVNGTLILLNGRRIAPHAFSTSSGKNFVDLNSIPPSAIERIEILKDGASAVYGSDALAGVVNFILRSDFEGLELNSSYGNNTGSGDFHTLTLDAAIGITSGKGSLKVFTNFYKRAALQRADRGYVADANFVPRNGFNFRSGATYPGRFTAAAGQPGHGLAAAGFVGDGRGRTLAPYNFNQEITDMPEARRYGLTAIGDYMISDSVTLFTELTYQRNFGSSQFAAAPSTTDFTVPNTNPYNPTNPANTAYFVPGLVDNTAYPNGINLNVIYRPLDPGNRIFDITTNMLRALFGAKGEIGSGWNWEVNYLYTMSRSDNLTRGLLIKSEVQKYLNNTTLSTALNPFALGVGQNNNTALYAASTNNSNRQSDLDVSQFQAIVSGELFDLPAGPIGVAFGAEHREESVEDIPSAASALGLLVGSGGTSSAGSRDGQALFAEVSAPLTRQFEFKGALRWDDYSDFGDSTIFTVGGAFRPTKDILMRISYSEGFKAPSLPQAYGGQTRGFPAATTDLIIGPAIGDTSFGTDRQFASITGGDPNLNPEESETLIIGIMIQPENMIPLLKGVTLGVDWWKIKATNLITTRTATAIRTAERDLYLANPAAFVAMDPVVRAQTTRVLREPNTTYPAAGGGTVTTVGRIIELYSTFENLASVDIEGFDIELAYRREFDFGRLDIRNTWVRTREYDSVGGRNDVGTFRLPKWRYNGSFGWTKGDISTTFLVNYISGYLDSQPTYLDGSRARVSSWTSYDARLSYRGIANTTVTLGINNILDKEAPFWAGDSGGYDPSFHNIIGRYVYLSVTKKF